MEIFIAVSIFIVAILIIVPISLYCCWWYVPYSRSIKRKKIKHMAEQNRDIFYVECEKNKKIGAPVIITSTTTTSATPGGYPVAVHGTTGGGLQATTYHANNAVPMPMPQGMVNPPYPTHGAAMPQPYGVVQGYPGNPPYPMGDPSRMNPPSYDQVVSSTSITQKQAPYNPNYMGN